ncbi:MAG: ABC transporter substrate-binding protein [Thermoleophilia bacterium]
MERRPLAGTRRLALLAVVVLLASGLVWGLATAFASSGSPSPGASSVTLKIGWTEEPDNLNPFIGYQNETYEIWAMNYDLLFGYGDRNQPTLDLASQFPTKSNGGISADGLTWTIKVRSGIKWQDGVPLTADDVAFTFNYIVKNQMANFTNSTFGIKSATALDPTTVRIVCSRPKADLETMWVPIIPQHIWGSVSPQAASTSYAVKLPLVGSGPFQTVAFKKGSYIHLVRNPTYWGPKPAIDNVYFEVYQDADTMVTDLKSGNIDAAWGIPQAQFSALKSDPSFKAVPYGYYNWNYLEFNSYDNSSSLGNPVLRDWKFRNALNYAVDKQRLAQLAYQGYAQPATTIIPPGIWTNPDYHWQPPADQTYTFDLAKAGQLLDQAGYRLSSGGVRLDKKGKPIKLRLFSSTDSSQEQSEAKVITGWLEKLGLKITLSVVDPGTLTSDIYNAHGAAWAPDFDLVVWNWTGYYDPGQTLVCFTTQQIGSLDEPFWSSAQYDALNEQQSSTIDPQARKTPIWQMQQLMYQQTPWIVLTYPDYLEAYNTTKWTGWAQMFNGHGPAFNTEGNIASYLNLRPKTATAGGGSSNTALIVAAAAAVVVVAIVVIVLRRRRPRAEED